MEIQCTTILLGDSGSGKTSIMKMFYDSSFDEFRQSTIGVDIETIRKKITDQETLKICIFEIGGDDKYMTIVKNCVQSFMRKANLAIIVYDVTSEINLQNQDPYGLASVDRWLNFIRESQQKNIQIIIVANKIDKINERVITSNYGIEFASQLGLPYCETSAKDKLSVDYMFESVMQIFLIHRNNKLQTPEVIHENKQLWKKMINYQKSIRINMAYLIFQLLIVIFAIINTNVIQGITQFEIEQYYKTSLVCGVILTLFSLIFLLYTGLTLKRR